MCLFSDTKDMPPPPMPANLDPTTVSSIPLSTSPRVLISKLSSLPSLSGTQTSDPPASPSPSTPFANLSLLSPTASYSSNSSPLSPKLSTLTSSFLSITSTLAFPPDPGAIQMDVDPDARSPSPQSLSSSEPLRRVLPPPMSRVESPSPASPSRQSSGTLPDAEPPPVHSSPRTTASPPPPPILQAVPKVKMSLKDFAIRKRKQREEEQARAVVLPTDSLSPSDPPSSEASRDPDDSVGDVATPRVATRSKCDVESHSESESGIVRAASPGALRDPAAGATTPITNGVLRRLSRAASPPPSPSDSEDSEASTTRMAPPTHPRSFSFSSTTTTTVAAPAPHRLPPSSTYRPGSSYVPPSIPAAVRPLPSGPRALRVGTNGVVAATTTGAPFASPVRGFQAAQFAGVPRGPSADRDRDRGWAATVRGRGRGTTSSSSWGR